MPEDIDGDFSQPHVVALIEGLRANGVQFPMVLIAERNSRVIWGLESGPVIATNPHMVGNYITTALGVPTHASELADFGEVDFVIAPGLSDPLRWPPASLRGRLLGTTSKTNASPEASEADGRRRKAAEAAPGHYARAKITYVDRQLLNRLSGDNS